MNGLDDLRGKIGLFDCISIQRKLTTRLSFLQGWTLRGAIQPHVDLYVTMHTFREVQRAFPYLVSKEFASGGGDVSRRD